MPEFAPLRPGGGRYRLLRAVWRGRRSMAAAGLVLAAALLAAAAPGVEAVLAR